MLGQRQQVVEVNHLRRVGFFEGDDDRVRVDDFGVCDVGTLKSRRDLRCFTFGIDDFFQREEDVAGDDRRAIRESRVRREVKRVLLSVGRDLPLLGESRRRAKIRIEIDQWVEEIDVDVAVVFAFLEDWIDADDVRLETANERAAFLWRVLVDRGGSGTLLAPVAGCADDEHEEQQEGTALHDDHYRGGAPASAGVYRPAEAGASFTASSLTPWPRYKTHRRR